MEDQGRATLGDWLWAPCSVVDWGGGVLLLFFSALSKTNWAQNYCHSEQLELPKPREAVVTTRQNCPTGVLLYLVQATLALLRRLSKFFKFKGWFDCDKFSSLYETQTSTY